MRFGSVCSGIGAPEQAWIKPLGWSCAFTSEIEPFPRAVLKHHHPEAPCHGDFTTIGADDYGPIDLLVGGTPCQSFSIAGLRGGLGDDRGNLALEFLRLADRKRPRWLVWENVPGVLSSNGGRDFGAILGGMVELGYGFAYRVLDAQFTRTPLFPWAVPQRRRRVFVVGYLGDWRPPAAVLFERESLLGHPPPRREAGQGFTHDVASSLTASGRGVERSGETRGQDPVIAIQERAVSINPDAGPQGKGYQSDLAFTLEARNKVQAVAHSLRAEGFDASEDGTGRGTPLVAVHAPVISPALKARDSKGPSSDGDGDGAPLIAVSAVHAFDARQNEVVQYGQITGPLDTDGGSIGIAFALRGREDGAVPEIEGDGDAAGALRAASGGSSRDYIAFTAKDHGADADDEVSPTLRSGGHDTSHANGGVMPAVASSLFGVRRLTPTECARLQGFPDDHLSQVPWRGKSRPADGPMYKAFGNSMAVNVLHYLGQRIELVEAALTAQQREAA